VDMGSTEAITFIGGGKAAESEAIPEDVPLDSLETSPNAGEGAEVPADALEGVDF